MKIENIFLKEKERFAKNIDLKRVPREELSFEIHIAEHCNLNCKGCFHFSPLADKELLSIEEYTKDIIRLSELFKGKMKRISLLGGEPLLNPDVEKFMQVTRKFFPEGNIDILTNGILLLEMKDSFWTACRENRVQIRMTKYPINLKLVEMYRRAEEAGVELVVFNNEDDIKMLAHAPIDVEGTHSALNNFNKCYRANTCVTLKHGILYTCLIPAHIHLLNKYYNLNIPIDEKNGINIYEAKDRDEILEYMIKPIPMCAYCDRERITDGHPFEISKREISEWT